MPHYDYNVDRWIVSVTHSQKWIQMSGQLVDHVGGYEHVHHLLVPLEVCRIVCPLVP